MAIPLSLRLPAAAIAALLLSLALPAVSHAHGGEIHGEIDDAAEAISPSEIANPTSAEAPAPITSTSPTDIPATQPLGGGEIVGALIFTAPFALTILKRRTHAKTALR